MTVKINGTTIKGIENTKSGIYLYTRIPDNINLSYNGGDYFDGYFVKCSNEEYLTVFEINNIGSQFEEIITTFFIDSKLIGEIINGFNGMWF